MIGFGESLFVKIFFHLFSKTVPKTTVQWILIPLQKVYVYIIGQISCLILLVLQNSQVSPLSFKTFKYVLLVDKLFYRYPCCQLIIN